MKKLLFFTIILTLSAVSYAKGKPEPVIESPSFEFPPGVTDWFSRNNPASKAVSLPDFPSLNIPRRALPDIPDSFISGELSEKIDSVNDGRFPLITKAEDTPEQIFESDIQSSSVPVQSEEPAPEDIFITDSGEDSVLTGTPEAPPAVFARSSQSEASSDKVTAGQSSASGDVSSKYHFPNKFLYIEGSAERVEHRHFFMEVFSIEAIGAGYTVTKSKDEAGYTFKFYVTANMTEYNGILRPDEDNKYIIRISLINNADNSEILFFDFFFNELDEMFEYTQSLFNMATVYIPPDRKEIYVVPDRNWQNKWLYFTASVDYPISFFALQPTGLLGGQAAYYEDAIGKKTPEHLDHIILPRPGLTLGLEFQFHKSWSAGLSFHINLGDPQTVFFFGIAAGASIKYNIKTDNFIIQPYLSGLLPLNMSAVFNEYPPLSLGVGVQAGVKGGASGMVFIDVGFMYSLGDVYMKNPYDYAPKPPQIHYKHFVFGISIGYKLGVFSRRN